MTYGLSYSVCCTATGRLFGLPLTLISLDDWALVTLTGADRVKYLQGQVTADIDALSADQHVLCAHCDAKGKCGVTYGCFIVVRVGLYRAAQPAR